VGSRPEPLGLKGLVEFVQGQLGAGLANVGQVGVEDGGVERFVTEISADLAQRNAFLQQVGGIAVTQRLLILHIGRLHAELNTGITHATARTSN